MKGCGHYRSNKLFLLGIGKDEREKERGQRKMEGRKSGLGRRR